MAQNLEDIPDTGLTRNVKVVSAVSLCQDTASEMLYPVLPIFLTATLGAAPGLVGVIEAGMFPQLLAEGQFDKKWIDETMQMLAIKRWGKPAEIGRAAVFLASNDAAYITGQQINVSGGFGI